MAHGTPAGGAPPSGATTIQTRRSVRLVYPRSGVEKSRPETAEAGPWQLGIAQVGWKIAGDKYPQEAGRVSTSPHPAAPIASKAVTTTARVIATGAIARRHRRCSAKP